MLLKINHSPQKTLYMQHLKVYQMSSYVLLSVFNVSFSQINLISTALALSLISQD